MKKIYVLSSDADKRSAFIKKFLKDIIDIDHNLIVESDEKFIPEDFYQVYVLLRDSHDLEWLNYYYDNLKAGINLITDF